MNYYEALRLFNIDNSNEIEATVIKKKYRTLVKKWHPDVCGDDTKYKEVQDAYKIINDYLKAADKNKLNSVEERQKTVILEVKDILDIFKGKEIRINNNININKDSIARYNVFVRISTDIIIDGVTFNFSTIKPRNIKDEYVFDIMLPDTDLDRTVAIKVKLMDRHIEKEMSSVRMDFRFNLDYISQITIAVQRVKQNKFIWGIDQ